jgi:hypothetical protein
MPRVCKQSVPEAAAVHQWAHLYDDGVAQRMVRDLIAHRPQLLLTAGETTQAQHVLSLNNNTACQ